jgi:uncharacterized protein YPO0396
MTQVQENLPEGADEQFRLTRIQTFHWGTFSGYSDFPIPEDGYLFVGPSGSGKSTVLDAHAALLTPPNWVDFNVAAREAERNGKDRNLITYVRGAWAQQSVDGEFVSQYLRPDTTWSAIAETYRTGTGRIVTLAQVLWVRGKTTVPGDVKKHFLVFEDEFDLRDLDFFPASDFDARKFKQVLPHAAHPQEFRPFQERFRDMLGIANERALRLLHKTQSAKNLGDLNTFLRDFMLDMPSTFAVAERLVLEFGELNEAHQSVVAARKQIEALLPAQAEFMERESQERAKNELAEVAAGIDHFREQRRKSLIDERLGELDVEAEGSKQKVATLTEIADRELEKLTELKQRRNDMGGDLLERLQTQLQQAEDQKPARLEKRRLAAAACEAMGWSMPDEVVWFVNRVAAAKEFVAQAEERRLSLEKTLDDIKARKRDAEQAFQETVREVRSMEEQRSNIPSRLLAVRANLARATGIPEEKLPFVGELLEVRQDSADWQGAIERVLGGFARSILVDDKHYGAVSSYLNETNIGERLFYNRVMSKTAGNQSLKPTSLVRKLNIAKGEFAPWLQEELKQHFDFECAEDLQAFRSSPRAVTKQGQIKRDFSRHEKNDRTRVDDRTTWALGFDNKARLALFKERAADLGGDISKLDDELKSASKQGSSQRAQELACNTLQNLTWLEVDVASLVELVADLTRRIEAEREARPDLAKLDAQVLKQDEVHKAAEGRKTDEVGVGKDIARRQRALEGDLERIQARFPYVALTPTQRNGLEVRVGKTGREVTLEQLDSIMTTVERGLTTESKAIDLKLLELKHSIEGRFERFKETWKLEAASLDATLASAPDFFAKLDRLQTDGLPKFEERFMKLLRDQSDQNLTLLSSKLNQERASIRARMDLVNESLLVAPYNKDTHLVIDTKDKTLEIVREFIAQLKEALSQSFGITDRESAEHRFEVLQSLVKRLASQETDDKNWRAIVLDVRQHVEFIAREVDDFTGADVEVYQSGAGKSGGQRQKLAATCLAAALRYQLGGQDRALPVFSTVVLDEAFDKADAEFTTMAMNIFKTFGFQMIIATPMKSVMTLEPFIGGACYVYIKERKTSMCLKIDYDKQTKRLKLPSHVPNAEEAAAT